MDNSGQIKALEHQSIPALLWKFFLPAFTGVVINSLYNIVDRIFIGHGVGAHALSGLSVVFPIMIILMAFGMLIGMGAGVRISINLGKKDLNRAELVLGNAFILIIIISIFLTIATYIIKDPLLKLFGASEATIPFANDYLKIILPGTIFNMMGFSLNNLIRSEGNPKIAMYSMLISAGSNIVLDAVFIFGFDMGVKGAAYATVISMILLCAFVLRHFTGNKAIIRLRRKNIRIVKDIVVYIITIGFAPFSMQLASSAVQGLFNIQLIKYGGDMAVAAMGIINSVVMFLIMSIIAINMAAQPIIGFNYGAHNYFRVRQTLKISLIAATIISVSTWIFAQFFPGAIVKTFNAESAELLMVGTEGLRLIMLTFPLVGFQIVAGNYFQSIGKAKTSALLSLLRQVLLLIPFILILPNFWGIKGVWLSAPIADSVSAIIVTYFLVSEWKKLKQSEQEFFNQQV